MKIDVAPWIRDYRVEMDRLYADLSLVKVDDVPLAPRIMKLSDSEAMFFSQKSHKGDNVNKILLVSDPGYGKTSLSKKISWDWAKGVFTAFTIIFIVLLKMVKPGDAIENVIIEQTPALEGMGVSPQKLRRLLETFSDKCLIILEGLDEHAFGSNDDVLKIIQGRKLPRCGLIATSRPHSTHDVERYFQTVVNIKGFTKSSAEQFASKLLNDQEKENAVLEFSPYSSEGYDPWYQCPILLSFLCILVRDDDINLKEKAIPLGKIYTKLLRCLYKKFTLRKGIEYQTFQFIRMLQKVGKIAFETLISGHSIERSNLIQDLGGDAFNYGLIIGHEYSLPDERGRIYLRFLERGMQDFLASYYFIHELNSGENVDTLLGPHCENPIFTSNPLFLHFCLWLLKKSERHFSFRKSEQVYQSVQRFTRNKLMSSEQKITDLASLCGALNIPCDETTGEELITTFFGEIIDLLKNEMVIKDEETTERQGKGEVSGMRELFYLFQFRIHLISLMKIFYKSTQGIWSSVDTIIVNKHRNVIFEKKIPASHFLTTGQSLIVITFSY